MTEKENKQVKFGFGVDEEHCFSDEFDTVQELIDFATEEWEAQNSDYFNDDECVIYIGTIEHHKPSDFAPSLDDIADQMTDRFYCEHNIADNAECLYSNKEEAKREYEAFINKYYDLPYKITSEWNVGEYNVKTHEWIEKYQMFEEYVGKEG